MSEKGEAKKKQENKWMRQESKEGRKGGGRREESVTSQVCFLFFICFHFFT